MGPLDDSDSAPTLVRWRDEVRISVPPCLVVIYGAELGRRLELCDRSVVLGRSPSCDLVAELEDVSREHCRIEPRDGRYWLTDLGSTNGTWLEERRLDPGRETELPGGSRVRIGSLILKFLDGRDVEALYHEEIYRLTIVDGLTALCNRRYFEEFLAREVARWRRHRRPLALALFDLDELKAVNDRHGHPAGDGVLQQLAAEVRKTVRREACLARISGDEFAVALPETPIAAARIFAERLRTTVEFLTFRVGGEEVTLTISVGLAEMSDALEDPAALVEEADRNLYRAKQEGRNRTHG